MKAIFTEACGGSQMQDILEPPLRTYKLPMVNPNATPCAQGGWETRVSSKVFELWSIETVDTGQHTERMAMYIERWV
jgi:hypothetical protein